MMGVCQPRTMDSSSHWEGDRPAPVPRSTRGALSKRTTGVNTVKRGEG